MSQRLPALVVFVVAIFALAAPRAHADSTQELINQLDSGSKNVRLAAAVNLAKLKDTKIIMPFIKLMNDDDDQVRSVAANGLGRMVNPSTKPVSIYNLTVRVLTAAADQDPSADVKQQAVAALAQVTGKAGGATPNGGSTPSGPGASSATGGIYVNIGPMSSKTGTDDAKLRDLMVKTAGKAMTKAEPKYQQTWPGGVPSRAALDKQKVAGFYVDGTLNEVTIKESGSDATVSCKVSMLLASFPEKSVFGFLNGGAKVAGSNTASDKALATQDCVEAVISDLITKKIIPTIKTKVP